MENVTKDDLRELRILIINDIEKLIDEKFADKTEKEPQEWLRSKSVRQILNISPATLQNLRISGKLGFKKIMGSYYYKTVDMQKMFTDGK
ncbi:helix-turn-helix domain-containing protein [Pedobacter sp. KLB.chiD]|uniref:helix-turn-helix domain-containing protein n=1 Tax=Pedobacter sp. KLB.chiD TaxID=3387402 RepID=UPI00399AA2F3